ncbi:hypothetical protein Angca_006656, partial [Angiostrongylus cantonensis]
EMYRKLQQQRPALVSKNDSILLYDNARPHVAEAALLKFNELDYEILPHRPYLLDFSPTAHHFFKHLDNFLSKKCFTNHDDTKNAFNDFITSRTPEFCATGTIKPVYCCQKC